MNFLIRSARASDKFPLVHLSSSLSEHGFLTLPSDHQNMEELIQVSEQSFSHQISSRDSGRYLFVLEGDQKILGCSLIVARHGTHEDPHLYFQMDPEKMWLVSETSGRTELGGLFLDPSCRRHPEKLGKHLSYVRLLYIRRNPEWFLENLLAEFLPQNPKGWVDKSSLLQQAFPQRVSLKDLPQDVRKSLGIPGLETQPAVKILEEAGFQYLHQIDPLDGGPHYGAKQNEILWDKVEEFLSQSTKVKLDKIVSSRGT